MRRALIGVTTYGRNAEDHFHLPAEYVDSVRRAGGSVALLPPGEDELDGWLARVDGVILAGGGDIDPSRYGGVGHETLYMVDAERDRTEFELVTRMLAAGLPTLAICRGAQVLNVVLGGTLHAHLPDVVGDAVAHRAPPREPTPHPVSVDAESKLAGVLGECRFEAASWHHQAIDRVAPGLRVVARASDGTVEAVEMATHPWLVAVQWHPELTAGDDPVQQRLFDALVVAAGGTEGKRSRCDSRTR